MMKIASIFLAAVMTFALAGQAAEARDHDGWRHHHGHYGWHNNNNNWNRWNRGNHYGWRNNHRYHAWNNRWDTNGNGRFDRQDRKRINRQMNSRWY
jgi:hypothetical protein